MVISHKNWENRQYNISWIILKTSGESIRPIAYSKYSNNYIIHYGCQGCSTCTGSVAGTLWYSVSSNLLHNQTLILSIATTVLSQDTHPTVNSCWVVIPQAPCWFGCLQSVGKEHLQGWMQGSLADKQLYLCVQLALHWRLVPWC